MAFVGVKFDNFNKKLIEVHKQDEEILAKYGIQTDIEDDECFVCGAEKLNFFYSKNTNVKTQGEEKRGYLKCKCFSCNFTGDVLDIVKAVDPNLKNYKPGAIVDYLLSEEFQKRPNIIDVNREFTREQKQILKDWILDQGELSTKYVLLVLKVSRPTLFKLKKQYLNEEINL